MDPVLSGYRLAGLSPIPMLDAASVALARQAVREQAGQLNLPEIVTGSLANIASELGHNQLAHAHRGQIGLRAIVRDGTPGLEIIAADTGPGIRSPTAALRGPAPALDVQELRQKRSLGIGLAAVLELADELDFDVRIGEGSCVCARKFAAAVPRRREVGIYGRPCPGEDISGDDAAFVREEHDLLVGLSDGLGHGGPAREASRAAIERLCERSGAALEAILDECHGALQGTRGAVMAAVRVHEPEQTLESAGVGNVTVRLYGPQLARRFSGPSFVLGSRGQARKPSLESHPIGARDVLVLFSDGLSGRFELDSELDLLREHPIVIAHQLLERFARDNDDALVLVAR